MRSFKEKLENFWYYYKWHTVIGAFFVFFAIIAVYQLVSKESVDTYVLYAGPRSLTADEIEEVEGAFRQFSPDLDGDGKKNVVLTDIVMLTSEQIEENKRLAAESGVDYYVDLEYMAQMKSNFATQIAAGDAYVCLLSPELYAIDFPAGAYMTLEELGIDSEGSSDGISLKFSSLPFSKAFSVFGRLPDDTVIAFRRMGALASAKGKSEHERFESQKALFKDIVEFGR